MSSSKISHTYLSVPECALGSVDMAKSWTPLSVYGPNAFRILRFLLRSPDYTLTLHTLTLSIRAKNHFPGQQIK